MQNVTCVELRIPAHAIEEDAFAQLAAAFRALGSAEESDAITRQAVRIAWFEADSHQQEQHMRLTAAAQVLGVKPQDIHLATLNDDWATAWQKHWSAMPIGKSLCVRPSFCEALPNRAVDVVLDPGQAFGTGTHPTTCLCLEALESYCLDHPPQSLLDMGAGSGLLAIAAGKMGAKNMVCVDYDPLSVEACKTNAAINHIHLESVLSDTPPTQTFELVVANILLQPLLDMAQPLAACVEKQLILSGILTSQLPTLIEAYQAQGLQLADTRHQETWAAVSFVRQV